MGNQIAIEKIEDLGDPGSDHDIARKLFESPSPVLRTRTTTTTTTTTTTLFREEEEENPVVSLGLFSNGGSQAAERSRYYYRFINAGGIPKNLFGPPLLPVRTRRSDQSPDVNGSPSMVVLENITPPPPSGDQGRARFPIYHHPTTPLHEIERRRDRLRNLLISLWNDIFLLEFPNPKKLLNVVDVVEKIVMKEICRFRSTPSAKEAERKRKVSTLMSMRVLEKRVSKMEKEA